MIIMKERKWRSDGLSSHQVLFTIETTLLLLVSGASIVYYLAKGESLSALGMGWNKFQRKSFTFSIVSTELIFYSLCFLRLCAFFPEQLRKL